MSIKPFSALPGSMEKLGSRVQQAATQIVRQVAVGIGATLVDTTRVDTGKARSNWRATLNSPASGVIPPYSPGNKLGKGEIANANLAKAQQKQVINRFNARKDRSVMITNNVPYIGVLNNGRSGEGGAPDNMVGQALQTGRLILKTIRVLEVR